MKTKRKLVCINGEAWCHTLTGIERLAIEVTENLDKMVLPNQIELVVPKNAKNLPELKNIKIVTLNTEATFFPKWTQGSFQKYVISHRAYSFDFSNTCPFFSPGFEFIHDIYPHLHPEDFKTKRDKLIKFYSNLMYRTIAKRAKIVFTVSEYTKKTIVETYHTKPEKIKVVYSGVSDYNNVEADDNIFEKFPILKEKHFFFTLGSLSTRKNLKWIAKHASLFPNEFFVISGKPLPSVVPPELEPLKTLENVLMAGYLSDGDVKALLSKCRAFVLPSYFEGFGLPPLEALSAGAQIIISDKTSLPEIYGKCAHYIDPDNPNVNLEELLSEPVENPDELLKKYTLENTAKRIFKEISPFLK